MDLRYRLLLHHIIYFFNDIWDIKPYSASTQCHFVSHFTPSPPIDSIWVMMFVWRKRGDHQNCSVLFHVLKLCTVISTLTWAVLTVLWIGFCLTGSISLCLPVDLFVLCVFVFLCFILHSCCIIVSTVAWTWWDWSLILWTYLPSVLWHCWLGHLTRKNPSPIWPIMCLVGR